MSYSIRTIPKFDKQLKKISKKHPSFKSDFLEFLTMLKISPEQGVYLGKNCYKVRMAISSKGKGKSSGARVITNIVIADSVIFLLSIYDKSDKESISDKELAELINEISD